MHWNAMKLNGNLLKTQKLQKIQIQEPIWVLSSLPNCKSIGKELLDSLELSPPGSPSQVQELKEQQIKSKENSGEDTQNQSEKQTQKTNSNTFGKQKNKITKTKQSAKGIGGRRRRLIFSGRLEKSGVDEDALFSLDVREKIRGRRRRLILFLDVRKK